MRSLVIPIMALMFIPSWVRADGIPEGYTLSRDGSKVVRADERTRFQKAAWRSSCGEFIYPAECRRIRAKSDARAREVRRYGRVADERVMVVNRRDRDDRDDYRGNNSGRCWNNLIKAKGAQRPGIGWATRLAIEAWQREVRYDAGETYLTWSRARKIGGEQEAGIVCNESAITPIVKQYRCEAKAYPCKSRD